MRDLALMGPDAVLWSQQLAALIIYGLVCYLLAVGIYHYQVKVYGAQEKNTKEGMSNVQENVQEMVDHTADHSPDGSQSAAAIGLGAEETAVFSLEDTQAAVYRQEQTVYNKEHLLVQGLDQIEQAAVEQIKSEIAAGKLPADKMQEALEQTLAANAQYVAYMAQTNVLTGQQSQLQSGLNTAEQALSDLSSGFLQADETLTELDNTKKDLQKYQEDWQKEVKLIVRALAENALILSKNAALLQDKYDYWKQKVLAVTEQKYAVGLAVAADIETAKLEASASAEQLITVTNGLAAIKRQLNDLMGRALDAPSLSSPLMSQPRSHQYRCTVSGFMKRQLVRTIR